MSASSQSCIGVTVDHGGRETFGQLLETFHTNDYLPDYIFSAGGTPNVGGFIAGGQIVINPSAANHIINNGDTTVNDCRYERFPAVDEEPSVGETVGLYTVIKAQLALAAVA